MEIDPKVVELFRGFKAHSSGELSLKHPIGASAGGILALSLPTPAWPQVECGSYHKTGTQSGQRLAASHGWALTRLQNQILT